jgi:hypothetical protein
VDVSPVELLSGTIYTHQLVRVTNVTLADWPGLGPVDALGSLLLQGSGLVVKDSIYWRAEGAPVYGSGQVFASMVGINGQPQVVGTACAYALLPRNKCFDLAPKSQDCP